ncbi:MAG: prepilin-type N-terminal cleavage/methylation domain-containing protein [Pyrinomonadaceae bacterium]|nr:prepilin-type N-terminal cleavage/methylation domain-containing protein [Pyrinomonadaceae bacterium]
MKFGEKGLTLIECLVAMVVTMVGLLAVFQLIALSVQIENFSYRSIEANNLAVNKLEELKVGTLTNGGSLTTDVSGYSDTSNANYIVRWQISDGTVGVGTKYVVVQVFPQNAGVKQAEVKLETLIR